MLKTLHIQNYAILRKQEVSFAESFNIITGETGAGKSILLGALDLLLGARADTTVLYNKEEKCIVEGHFRMKPEVLRDFFQKHDLDGESEVIIRREISVVGKSRAFVNDTPVLINQLKELGGLLLDVHQQFAVLELQETDYQVRALDAFSGITASTREYFKSFQELQELKSTLQELQDEEQQSLREQDYLIFQRKEFDALQLSVEGLEELETQLQRLTHGKEIKTALQASYFSITERDNSVLDNLQAIEKELSPFLHFDAGISTLADRLEQVMIELRDIAAQLQDLDENLDIDPGQLEELDKQLQVFHRLQLKHNAKTAADLMAVRVEIEEKLESFDSLGDRIKKLEKEIASKRKTLTELAKSLSSTRNQKAPEFSKAINGLLAELKMENARVKIDVASGEPLNKHGIDHIEYLFSPNKGSDFHPMKKVASGGELSRLSMCIKAIVAKKMDMPTLVFDEIDQGVSGEVARRMGDILTELSGYHQVIMITHSPQIASRAKAHFHVVKKSKEKDTIAEINELRQNERVIEIAKMLSGDPPTSAAVENAKELITPI